MLEPYEGKLSRTVLRGLETGNGLRLLGDDEMVNSIEDLEREILAQNIHKQVAVKYLESLQVDLSQKVGCKKREQESSYQNTSF